MRRRLLTTILFGLLVMALVLGGCSSSQEEKEAVQVYEIVLDSHDTIYCYQYSDSNGRLELPEGTWWWEKYEGVYPFGLRVPTWGEGNLVISGNYYIKRILTDFYPEEEE